MRFFRSHHIRRFALFAALLCVVISATFPISGHAQGATEEQLKSYQNVPDVGWVAEAVSTSMKAAMDYMIEPFFNFGAMLVMNLLGMILWIAGILLNETVKFTIVNMATNIGPDSALGGSIDAAWLVFRDLANMSFIFIILYLAFQLILGTAGGKTWRSLSMLIIVALLVNFSLMFTKIVIDASNVLAMGFYTAITQGSDAWGLAGTFMQQLGLSTIFNTNSQEALNAIFGQSEGIGTAGILLMLGSSIFVLIAAFVFFALSLLLITRFVYLIFLMMASPLAFAAYVIPGTQGYFNKWWSKLLNQAFFAPAVFALLWVSFTLLGGISKILINQSASGDMGSFGEALSSMKEESVLIVLNFAISIGFLVYSLILAKNLGAYGAATVGKWGQSARKWSQGVAGRNIIAKPLRSAILENQNVKAWAAQSRLGQTLYGATNKAVGSSFGAGKGGSLKDVEKKSVEERAKYAEWLTKKPDVAPRKGGSFQKEPPQLPRTYLNATDNKLYGDYQTNITNAQTSAEKAKSARETSEAVLKTMEEDVKLGATPEERKKHWEYRDLQNKIAKYREQEDSFTQEKRSGERLVAELEEKGRDLSKLQYLKPEEKVAFERSFDAKRVSDLKLEQASANLARLTMDRTGRGLREGMDGWDESVEAENKLREEIKFRTDAVEKEAQVIAHFREMGEEIRRKVAPTDEEFSADQMEKFWQTQSKRGPGQRLLDVKVKEEYEKIMEKKAKAKKSNKKKGGEKKEKGEGGAEETTGEVGGWDEDELRDFIEKEGYKKEA